MKPLVLPKQSNSRIPEQPFPYRHYMPIQIRFTDIDAMGHVNNAVYLNYMDMGKTRYFEDVRRDGVDWHDIGAVIVNLNCSFFAPTLFEENIQVLTTVTSIGEKSFTMEQRVINSDTLEVKAVCTNILAGFDRRTGKSTPIAQEWVDAIEAYEERKVRR